MVLKGLGQPRTLKKDLTLAIYSGSKGKGIEFLFFLALLNMYLKIKKNVY